MVKTACNLAFNNIEIEVFSWGQQVKFNDAKGDIIQPYPGYDHKTPCAMIQNNNDGLKQVTLTGVSYVGYSRASMSR